uniref:Uncharacterized protein n=1 Tax=Rhizophora mucronata TaxID=61149 RepID=A0A2P2PGW5_RHIMU
MVEKTYIYIYKSYLYVGLPFIAFRSNSQMLC